MQHATCNIVNHSPHQQASQNVIRSNRNRRFQVGKVVLDKISARLVSVPFLRNTNGSIRRRFSHSMIADCIMTILQCRFGHRRVGHNTLVVTVDIGWSINGNTKHPQLVPQAFHQLHSNPQCNKLTSKCTGLNCILPLLYHTIGTLFTKIKIPMWERRVTRLPA